MAAEHTRCPRVLSLTLARERDLALGWLDVLPHAETLCAAICLKGMQCDSAPVKSALAGLHFMRVHSCVEEPGGNENGHEGVCAFRFLLDNYEKPWQHVFFLHGDANTPHHVLVSSELTRYLKRNEWPVWPARYADIKKEHCGCKLMTDAYPSRDRAMFGPKDFWFTHLTWYLGTMLRPRDPTAAALAERWAAGGACARPPCSRGGHGAYVLHNGSLASPMSYMFSVDRRSALQRSKAFLEANYRMCKVGVRSLEVGMSGAPRAARLRQPGFDFNPLVWGHVNERLAFFQFAREFDERPVPDCVWHVSDHASMNCSQPLVLGGAGGARPHLHHANANRSGVGPAAPWACKPLENCGTNVG